MFLLYSYPAEPGVSHVVSERYAIRRGGEPFHVVYHFRLATSPRSLTSCHYVPLGSWTTIGSEWEEKEKEWHGGDTASHQEMNCVKEM